MNEQSEVTNLVRLDSQTQQPELPWLQNLDVAYRRVQLVVGNAFQQAVPDITLPQPASLLVVPDNHFQKYIMTGVDNATKTTMLKTRKNEIVSNGELMASAVYINHLGTIVLPEKTAKAFQRGGIEAASVMCVLAEEYIHHLTTIVSLDRKIERMGLYEFDSLERVVGNYEPGEIYHANLHTQPTLLLPEAAEEPNAILTENATSVLVHCLAPELVPSLFDHHGQIVLMEKTTDYGVTLPKIPALARQLIKAMMTGKPSHLGLVLKNILPPNEDVNIQLWMGKIELQTFLLDLNRTTGNNAIDIFCYQNSGNYPGLYKPKSSSPRPPKGRNRR